MAKKSEHEECDLILNQVEWWGMRHEPFFTHVALELARQVSPWATVPTEDGRWVTVQNRTALTDGEKIVYNPDFLKKQPTKKARGLVFHEALHVALFHLWRVPHDQWAQRACDWEVNHIVSSLPDVELPDGALMPPPEAFLPSGELMGLEELYLLAKKLYPNLAGPGKGKGGGQPGGQGEGEGECEEISDPGNCGAFSRPAPDQKEKDGDGKGKGKGQDGKGKGKGSGEGDDGKRPEAATLRQKWERRIIQAHQIASAMGRGDLPGCLGRMVDKVLHIPIDWKQETVDFVKSVVAERNDWSRSARRHAWQPVIYPRKRVDDYGLLVAAIDTSGSIGSHLIAIFLAHLSQCQQEMNCRILRLDCDAAIQAEYWLEPGMENPLLSNGGGGTSHVPVWERVRKLKDDGEHVSGVVCLTDMATCFGEDPEVPVLWLAAESRAIAPFGRTVRIET